MARFRVYHVPQIPMEAFVPECRTYGEALRLSNVLSDYDHFQYMHKIKPDYCNVSCVQIFDEGIQGWEDIDEDEATEREFYTLLEWTLDNPSEMAQT